eukprot:jgi/Psemu1/49512/gm1.49512_g
MATTSNDISGEVCDSLLIGSFYFININAWPVIINPLSIVSSDRRNGEVIIFGFQDIPGNLNLYLTDRAWGEDGTGGERFVPNLLRHEGIVKFTTPPEGVPAGVAFGMGDDIEVYKYGEEWIDIDVNGTLVEGDNATHYLDLGPDGDQLFLYCVGSDGKDRPIAGISYNGPFQKSEFYGTNTSSAPKYFEKYDIESGANKTTLLVMPTVVREDGSKKIFWKWEYVGPTFLNFYELQGAIRDTENNWLGTNPDGTTSSSTSPMHGTAVMTNAIAFLIYLFFVLKKHESLKLSNKAFYQRSVMQKYAVVFIVIIIIIVVEANQGKQMPTIQDIESRADAAAVFTFKSKRVPIQTWKRSTWRLKQHDEYWQHT